MNKQEIVDMLENLRQVSDKLQSIPHLQAQPDADQDFLHKEEFRLSMEEASLKRKIGKRLDKLVELPGELFYVNRIKKTIGLV